MRSMSRWTLAGCMALAALGAAAVLDVGAGTAEAAPSVSQFAGSWSGTWAHVEDDDVGTADWTISDAGRITGKVYDATQGASSTIVGHVDADGNLVLIAAVPSDDVPASASGYPHQVTAVIDGDGRLVVSATATGAGAVSFVAIFERN
jgi:hypothetical protein